MLHGTTLNQTPGGFADLQPCCILPVPVSRPTAPAGVVSHGAILGYCMVAQHCVLKGHLALSVPNCPAQHAAPLTTMRFISRRAALSKFMNDLFWYRITGTSVGSTGTSSPSALYPNPPKPP